MSQELRQHYIGALGLLARLSVHVRTTHEETAEDLRDAIDRALEDGERLIPGLRVTTCLHRREISFDAPRAYRPVPDDGLINPRKEPRP